MNKKDVAEVIISASAGVAIGYGVGVFVTQRRMKAEIERILDEEVARMKADMEDIHARINKTGPYATAESAAETLIVNTEDTIEVPEDRERGAFGQYHTESELPEDEKPVTIDMADMRKFFKDAGDAPTRPESARSSFVESNVFDTHEDESEDEGLVDLDEDEEIDTSRPYVITLDQFQTTRDDHHKAVVIYYEGDDTLTDETDTLIDDIEGNVGRENLERFGHGSGAKNTVYIRNEKNGVDYEMVRMKRGWAEEKFGISPEPEAEPKIRRMRGDDE